MECRSKPQPTVRDQLTIQPQRPGDLLHRLDAGAHCRTAPFVEELSGPSGRVVIPELLKGFLEKVGTDGLQVVADQNAEPEALAVFQIVFASEQEPPRFLQSRHAAFAPHAIRLFGADVVERQVHLRHDMKPVEDVQRLRALLADNLSGS